MGRSVHEHGSLGHLRWRDTTLPPVGTHDRCVQRKCPSESAHTVDTVYALHSQHTFNPQHPFDPRHS